MIFTAPNHVESLDGPLIFLAGPIQGAPDWQRRAVREIFKIAPKLHIASPRAPTFGGDFDAQVEWETKYLTRAAEHGCIMIWCAREAAHRCDRAFAQTTRFEAGEWFARSKLQNVKVVVGFEIGFTGERYWRKRIHDTYRNVPTCSTLQQTCAVAVELAGVALPKAISLMHREDD